MPKNKLTFALYLSVIVALSVSSSFAVFFITIAIALFLGGARRMTLFRRALGGVIFFTGFTLFGSIVAAFLFAAPVEFYKIGILFGRSFSITLLTLAFVERVGVMGLFPSASLFFALIFAKIETLSKEIENFKEAARSRGMQVSFKDAITLLSVGITALFIKSMEGFVASHEAMRSRGYGV